MADLSFFSSLFQMKEIQVFFAIIAIGILVYLAIVLVTGIFRWIFPRGKVEPEYKSKKVIKVRPEDLDNMEIESESKEAAKEVKKKEGAVSVEKIEVDEKPLLTFEINMILFERVIYVLIIIAEISVIVMNYMK